MKLVNRTAFAAGMIPLEGPEGWPLLVVMVKATFDLTRAPDLRPADEMLPIAFADELVETERGMLARWEADVAPPKLCTDVLVTGRARAPRGKPVPSLDVRVRVGPVDKTLRVFGARAWRGRTFGGDLAPGEPAPFAEAGIEWTHAFGGAQCPENPLGVGFFAEKTKKKEVEGTPLPAVEDPAHPIRRWTDHPRPAGFGCVGRGWPPRLARLGTYDERWQRERAPAPPLDFSFRSYNAAPDDQQVEGYLRGDEAVEITHLTRDGTLAFRLPGRRPAVTVTRRNSPRIIALTMNLDTVGVQADERRLVLVWRGGHRIPALDDPRVAEVVVGEG
jgi:hypothetical protein